ncbi:MAG: segregation and condensation protein A [bacterium]
MVYEVKLENFKGPLDLLYQLVKKNEIEINKISLAKITEQYLEYTDYFQKFDLDLATEFTVIASELIELKINHLLPRQDNEEDEGKTNLVQRLKKYHLYKKISQLLRKREKEAENIFYRPTGVTSLDIDDYELELDIKKTQLKKTYIDVWNRKKETEEKQDIEEELNYLKLENIKVEDKIKEIEKTLKKTVHNVFFYHLVNDKNNILEVVVTMLGILELIKLKKIKVEQKSLFDNIKIIDK